MFGVFETLPIGELDVRRRKCNQCGGTETADHCARFNCIGQCMFNDSDIW